MRSQLLLPAPKVLVVVSSLSGTMNRLCKATKLWLEEELNELDELEKDELELEKELELDELELENDDEELLKLLLDDEKELEDEKEDEELENELEQELEQELEDETELNHSVT